MSIGATIYGYRNNFNCKQTTTKKGRTTKIKLFNLIINGFRTVSKYDDDYFISIAQYFMKKGYPKTFGITNDRSNIDDFFQSALFSIDPFHWQYLMMNNEKFDVFEWREQFKLFEEVELKGLNFYRKRSSMPLPNFTSMQDIYTKIFSFSYKKEELLKFQFNSSHSEAIYIITKRMTIAKDRFYYCIDYGYKDDFEDAWNKQSHSSWTITISSEMGENFIDFCLSIFNNYDAIISGDKNVLISEYKEEKHFYLGGNFQIRSEV
ncbi:hypothetical protein [Soonwooa purpurea]